MTFREDLERLCREAYSADVKGSGSVVDFEPQLEAILSHCQRAITEGNEDEVVSGLVAVGKGEIEAPEETVMFCLHKLRLARVVGLLDLYQKSLDPDSRRSHEYKFGYLPEIRESITDEWDAKDLFRAYRESK